MSRYPETVGARPLERDGLVYYEFPVFDAFAEKFRAGFSTRLGGVSQGGYAGLNLGVSRGDDPAAVAENFQRFSRAAGFDPAAAVLSQQTHTLNIRFVTRADQGKGFNRPRDYQDVDGLITDTPDLPLLTNYADCVPLVFYAPDRGLAGNAHAGWRGTVQGMARAMVASLAQLGADPGQLRVAIGPSAGPCCYEVDEATAACFKQLDGPLGTPARPISGKPGKYLADLWLANQAQLLTAGVPESQIGVAGLCTICHHDLFYSHRIQGENRGAMLAVAMLL